MRLYRTLAVVLILTLIFPAAPAIQPARAAAPQQAIPAAPRPLCMPGIYAYEPGDCIAGGPSAFMRRMADSGMHLPLAPLTYAPIDPALSNIEFHYAEVRNNPAAIFGSAEDARQGGKKGALKKLTSDFMFVSYTDESVLDGKKFYQVDMGQWMTGNDLSRLGILPSARGITFQSTPAIAFGWALTYFTQNGVLETQRAPGYTNPNLTGHILNLYDIVAVYGEQDVDGEKWYMLGPDEWAPAKYVARVKPNPTPPAGVSGNRWIEVNLFDQTLAVYDQGKMVFATIIASGADPFWTRPGVFKIEKKYETTPMSGAVDADGGGGYYLEDVPWTMYFDGPRALHGAYWRAKMGFTQSHGCVNLTVGDAHWLFNWGQVGDYVYVWDPSGKTPTDEALYSSGGY